MIYFLIAGYTRFAMNASSKQNTASFGKVVNTQALIIFMKPGYVLRYSRVTK